MGIADLALPDCAATLLSERGKDSAWTLHMLRQQGVYDVVGLLTTVNSAFDRVAMHGTRASVLRAQAAAAGLPLMDSAAVALLQRQYEAVMQKACATAVREGIQAIAFGDLYLEDVRRYRERAPGRHRDHADIPLWGRDTSALVREMLDGGCGLASRVSIPKVPCVLRGVNSIFCLRNCRRERTHARRTASFTPVRMRSMLRSRSACAGCGGTPRWFCLRGFQRAVSRVPV